MVNEIINAIAIKINATFGDGYETYTKGVQQGLNEPCFFIAILQPERAALLGVRSRQTNPFDIHYFPEDETDNAGMIAVGEQLMDALEIVQTTAGDLYRGTDSKYQIIDGVLHFFVSYNVIMYKAVTVQDAMDTVDINASTKG